VTRILTQREINTLAADLSALLAEIEAGGLSATAAMRHRIEGAIAVLDVVQGRAIKFTP
jgi:hypothetical protein